MPFRDQQTTRGVHPLLIGFARPENGLGEFEFGRPRLVVYFVKDIVGDGHPESLLD